MALFLWQICSNLFKNSWNVIFGLILPECSTRFLPETLCTVNLSFLDFSSYSIVISLLRVKIEYGCFSRYSMTSDMVWVVGKSFIGIALSILNFQKCSITYFQYKHKNQIKKKNK